MDVLEVERCGKIKEPLAFGNLESSVSYSSTT